ncbi:hypothetical protein AA14337_3211 [Acetobacter malorum DSM 14337]|uniref:Uncharacterized protein n=1 Tax=Acetobacter malorum DSM 14337 TaxID=1307910 RepID=A0ABQ0Q0B0_9PROT|nr:hypothetical protein [Acetobacter malorum]KXV05787.1 hypothetical protein AD930_11750 [Acetobacter malorum]GBQ85979.1 hypothetical protein AA14337_3211 [Acetobacter malorum DSM 14337]
MPYKRHLPITPTQLATFLALKRSQSTKAEGEGVTVQEIRGRLLAPKPPYAYTLAALRGLEKKSLAMNEEDEETGLSLWFSWSIPDAV